LAPFFFGLLLIRNFKFQFTFLLKELLLLGGIFFQKGLRKRLGRWWNFPRKVKFPDRRNWRIGGGYS